MMDMLSKENLVERFQSRKLNNLLDYDMQLAYQESTKTIEMLVDLHRDSHVDKLMLSFGPCSALVKLVLTINSIDSLGLVERQYYHIFEDTIM